MARTPLVGHRNGYPAQAGTSDPVAVWIDDALRRGRRVLDELEPAESRAEVLAFVGDGATGRQVECSNRLRCGRSRPARPTVSR